MPRVSVLIPIYNAQSFLREALDSVFSQSFRDFEVIAVDDGSTDGTASILESYGDRLRIVRQQNRGRAAACNAGAAAALGEYVAFLDADDLWLPQKLECQLERCGHLAMSYTDCMLFGPMVNRETPLSSINRMHAGRVLDKLLLGNFITGSSVLIRRDAFHKHGGFDESYDCVQDWPLWLRVCAEHELGYVDEPLVRYRVHGGATSRKVRRTLPAHLRVLDDAFAAGGVAEHLRSLRRRALADAYGVVAYNAAEARDWLFSMSCSLRALSYQPARRAAWKQLVKSGIGAAGSSLPEVVAPLRRRALS